MAVMEMQAESREPLIEATKRIQHEGMVGDMLAQLAEGNLPSV